MITKKDAELDELSANWLEEGRCAQQPAQRATSCTKTARNSGEGDAASKKLRCRFLVSPTALHGEGGKLDVE